MAGIVESGSAHNLINTVVSGNLVPDATERKFVTFVNELGGVHTIIVDAQHAAKTGEELLKWFEHTRALVTTSASLPTDPNHRTPAQVLATADERMGYGNDESADHADAGEQFNPQGG